MDPVAQKITVRVLSKLRESARNAPYCFACFNVNEGGDLVLAHSNALGHSRGFAFKTPDYFGAIMCFECHNMVDGRVGDLSREGRKQMHQRAHDHTLTWWFETGLIE